MFERIPDPRENFLHKLEPGTAREPVFGSLALDKENQEVVIGENRQRLSPFEYQILWILVRAQGRPVTKPEIENFLYENIPDHKDLPLSNSLEVYMTRLRKILKSAGGDDLQISNDKGYGYFLEFGREEEKS